MRDKVLAPRLVPRWPSRESGTPRRWRPQSSLGDGTLSHIKLGLRHQCRTYQPAKLLSCSKTFSFKFCSVPPSIILFWQKVVCENLPCHNFVCDPKIQIPRLLGGFLYEAFPLANDYTCTTLFLVHVLRNNMHHVDLSDLQAGLPGSCVYPYIPDCSARE